MVNSEYGLLRDKNKLFNIDCLDYMKSLPSCSIDLIIAEGIPKWIQRLRLYKGVNLGI